jgi:tetratricopeptide (TPR) repeat protein
VDEAGRELLDLAMARPADARTRALAELAARPSPREATYALHALAIVERANSHVELGRLDKSRADLERAAVMLDGLGQAYDAATPRHNLAMVSYAAGDLVGALRQIEQAIEEYEAVEAQVPEAHADRCLILLAAGLTADAQAAGERAVELMEHDRTTAAVWLAYMESAAAGAALDAGDHAAATGHARFGGPPLGPGRQHPRGGRGGLPAVSSRRGGRPLPHTRPTRAAPRTARSA